MTGYFALSGIAAAVILAGIIVFFRDRRTKRSP